MEEEFNTPRRGPCAFFHFERPRLNSLFIQAIKYPLVTICAGAGYGKTGAVHDFSQQYRDDTAWIQVSERDNVGARFWENYTNTMSRINRPFANAIGKLGFPDNINKLSQYLTLSRYHTGKKPRIIVMDDFHFISNPLVIRFVESAFLNMHPESSLFLVSRCPPRINTANLVSRGRVFGMSEEDLCFTGDELAQYFSRLNISLKPENLHGILQDTGGWAFAVNLIARSHAKELSYTVSYTRSEMKADILRLMETKIWDGISGRLKNFLLRLSLLGHLSFELVALLAGPEEDLIAELELQQVLVRRAGYINAYLIHPLFLEFLATKVELLSAEEKQKTYVIAGEWCDKNGFKIDAVSYYEKIGDYKSIVNIFAALPAQIPEDIARYVVLIIERAPPQVFDTVLLLASTHLRAIMSQGFWQRAHELAEFYEEKYLKLPKEDPFRQVALANIYYCWAVTRASMNLIDDYHDFDFYFKKMDDCFLRPVEPGNFIKSCPGPWVCANGSMRKGTPEEYIGALSRSATYLARCFKGLATGEDDLAWGELRFYQGDIYAAETFITRALDRARERQQFELIHRALFYSMRIAVFRGDYQKADQALKEINVQLDEFDYYNRFTNYDISLAWYYYIMDMPEKVPEWIQEEFSPYIYAAFIENFANQAKARYCYMTSNYPPLLAYIKEMKERESYLYGRLEMLAIEACVHFKMKNRDKARFVLKEAYETALPNDLVMPFIELGEDMRSLAAFALKEPCGISPFWLENIIGNSSNYASRLNRMIAKHKQTGGMTKNRS